MAIASTKNSWNRGATAVSIFSMRRTSASTVARVRRSSSAMRAPVPAALRPRYAVERAVRIMPSTIAYLTSMWLLKAGEPDAVHVIDRRSISSRTPA
jgi:hypothetical protein